MPETPELSEVLLQVFRQNEEQFRAIQPGEVVSWDKSNQTATIQPLVRDRSGEDRPKIYKVPVIQPTTYHDIQVGETGLILICDKNPSRWWRDNQQSDPEGNASHQMSNAIFIPGLRSNSESRTIPSNTSVLEKPVAGGEVHLGVQGATKAVLHEDLITPLNSFLTALDAWGSNAWGNWALAAAGWTASVAGPLNVLKTAVYKSPSVKVED